MQTVVSLVSYPFLPAKVGGQKGIALFNKYFSKHVRLICVTVRNNDASKAEGYEVRNILSDSPARYINPFYFFKLRKILKETRATHLLIEHPYFGWLGMKLKWLTGIKLIVHSHNIESNRFRTLGKWWWKILWQYEKLTHRQADYSFFIHDDDKAYAIRNFRLHPERCLTVTYGIEWDTPPSREELTNAGIVLRSLHKIDKDEHILLFNGAFNYKPNLDALRRIIDTINPLLMEKEGFRYRIIIAGRDIPDEILNNNYPNMIITGFVDDIGLYFKGTDVFINPVVEGGGIKTKLVEALGYNINAVSTVNGAIGIPQRLCNGKLIQVNDDDWQAFADAITASVKLKTNISAEYYDYFYWAHNTKRAAEFIR
ncbi:MAG TPA: glycosyltransferase [Chitinophagaceae bacterium]